MNSVFNWGILGPGRIANTFVQSMQNVEMAKICAVASRDIEKAKNFSDKYQIQQAYGSYEELVEDKNIDIIYVATPHSHHYEHVMLALKSGKHVLCEKPLTLTKEYAVKMFDTAHHNNVYLMEAMWTRFLPVWQMVKQWIEDGIIGDVRMLMADFTHRSENFDPSDRKFDKNLAGGALLDIGVYPIALANFLFASLPVETLSTASIGKTGVDMQSSYLLRYSDGAQALLSSSFETHGPKTASICGTTGMIRVQEFWKGTSATIERFGKETEKHNFPLESNGMQYQAIAMMNDLKSEKLESSVISPEDSIAIATLMENFALDWQKRLEVPVYLAS